MDIYLISSHNPSNLLNYILLFLVMSMLFTTIFKSIYKYITTHQVFLYVHPCSSWLFFFCIKNLLYRFYANLNYLDEDINFFQLIIQQQENLWCILIFIYDLKFLLIILMFFTFIPLFLYSKPIFLAIIYQLNKIKLMIINKPFYLYQQAFIKAHDFYHLKSV